MGTDERTGWERENRTHFDEIVTNYDRIRWDYPDELYSDIVLYNRQRKENNAIEIGAGTGIATRPFLDMGYIVTAVEMGESMTAFLQSKFKGCPNFSVITSTFEDALLEDGSYDLVYAASAFHWVDASIGCPKVFRLLKNGGVFALFRNNAVPPDDNVLYEESQAVYEKHYNDYYKHESRPAKLSSMTLDEFQKPSEVFRGFRFESLEQYGFYDVSMKLYNATLTYNADDYITLLETYSDHRALPKSNKAALYAGVKEAIIRHGGYQDLNCVYQLYMGRKPELND